jgi:hypothetical protein
MYETMCVCRQISLLLLSRFYVSLRPSAGSMAIPDPGPFFLVVNA